MIVGDGAAAWASGRWGEGGHQLDVFGHGEDVEGAQGVEPPSGAGEDTGVAGEGGRVAGDVDEQAQRWRRGVRPGPWSRRCRRPGGPGRARSPRGVPICVATSSAVTAACWTRSAGRKRRCGGRPRRPPDHVRRPTRTRRARPPRPGGPRTARRRHRGRRRAHRGRGAATSRTASRSASAAPTWTCQKTPAVTRKTWSRTATCTAPGSRSDTAAEHQADVGREGRDTGRGTPMRGDDDERLVAATRRRPRDHLEFRRPGPRRSERARGLDGGGGHGAVVDRSSSWERWRRKPTWPPRSTATRTRLRQPRPSASPATASTTT